MAKLNDLRMLINQTGRQLEDFYEITDANVGSLLLIRDIEGEYHEHHTMCETDSVIEAFDFIMKNKMLKRECVSV